MALELLLVVQAASDLKCLILYLATNFVHVYTEKSNRALRSSYEYVHVHVCIYSNLWIVIFLVDPPLCLCSTLCISLSFFQGLFPGLAM